MSKLSIILVFALGGCVSHEMLLVNDKGEKVYCQGKSSWGAVSVITTTHQFNDCVNEAGARGYLPANSATAIAQPTPTPGAVPVSAPAK